SSFSHFLFVLRPPRFTLFPYTTLFRSGEVVGVEGVSEFVPPAFEDEAEFHFGQGPVFVGEADSAVKLGVAAELFFDPGHADQDQSHVGAVVLVAKVFQSVGTEAFGFVDDEQVNVFESYSRWTGELAQGFEMLVNADGDPGGEVCEILLDLFRSGEYSGREKDGAFSGQGGIDLEV